MKGARLSRSVQRGVRKIVGDCFNSIVDCRVLSWSNTFAQSTSFPNLFGIASSWFLDKSDMLDFMNAFLTTAQRDANQHIYPQNCVQKWQLHNPGNFPIIFEMYKMTIKCNKGQASGAYVSPTTSTQSGPDLTSDVELSSTLWDQSMRDVVNGAIVPCSSYNGVLAVNGLGIAATIPVAGAANPWEECKTAYPFRDLNSAAMKTRLGWIFPKLKSQVKISRVFKGVVPLKGHRTFRIKEKWPNEIRPLDLLDRYVPTLKKDYSYFYFIRARAGVMSMAAANPLNATIATSFATSVRQLPVQLIVRHYREWGCRSAGDHIPNYLCGTTLTTRLRTIGDGSVVLQEAGGPGHVIPNPEWGLPIQGNGYVA